MVYNWAGLTSRAKGVTGFWVVRSVLVLLFFISGNALAGGGTWKIGPFGPYWDDNSWPVFTPMYWMEEFLNQLDDDDAEIQQWMMRNQYQGAQQPQGQGGYSPGNTTAATPYNSMQLNVWTAPDQMDAPMSGFRNGAVPVNPSMAGSGREMMNRAQPGTRQQRVAPQRQVNPSAQAYRPPANRQQQPASRPAARSRYPEFESLPDLTPQAFSRMPPQLQQQYEQAFNQAFMNYQKRREIEQALRQRPPAYERPRNRPMPPNYPRY